MFLKRIAFAYRRDQLHYTHLLFFGINFSKITLTLQPENITYIIFVVLGINFLKIYISVTRLFSGVNFPKITFHVFVCDSENCMEILLGNFSWKTSFQLHKRMLSELISRSFPAGVYTFDCDPGRHLEECPAFWVLLGTWLGVPQRALFKCFFGILGPKTPVHSCNWRPGSQTFALFWN